MWYETTAFVLVINCLMEYAHEWKWIELMEQQQQELFSLSFNDLLRYVLLVIWASINSESLRLCRKTRNLYWILKTREGIFAGVLCDNRRPNHILRASKMRNQLINKLTKFCIEKNINSAKWHHLIMNSVAYRINEWEPCHQIEACGVNMNSGWVNAVAYLRTSPSRQPPSSRPKTRRFNSLELHQERKPVSIFFRHYSGA